MRSQQRRRGATWGAGQGGFQGERGTEEGEWQVQAETRPESGQDLAEQEAGWDREHGVSGRKHKASLAWGQPPCGNTPSAGRWPPTSHP